MCKSIYNTLVRELHLHRDKEGTLYVKGICKGNLYKQPALRCNELPSSFSGLLADAATATEQSPRCLGCDIL